MHLLQLSFNMKQYIIRVHLSICINEFPTFETYVRGHSMSKTGLKVSFSQSNTLNTKYLIYVDNVSSSTASNYHILIDGVAYNYSYRQFVNMY